MVVDVTERVAKGLRIAGPVGTGDPLTVRSPWDGGEVATINTTRLDEVDLVFDRAVAAFAEWRWTPAWKRARILERTSHLLEDHADEIARLIALEGGKPIKDARVEARRGASTFRWASEEAKRTAGELIEMDADQTGENRFGWTIREPRGVIVAISPFNFPLNLVAHKVAPALAAANVVVLKPASSTPLTALRLAELLAEAGLPENVLQVVVGPGSTLGTKLVKDERVNMVTFTGSPPVGRRIASDAGMKMVTLELGNNSATIVDDDADLDLALQRVVAGGFTNSGQVCISVQRVVVHENVYDEFLAALVASVEALKVGDPLDETTDVAALIDEKETERVKAWVAEALDQGATLADGRHRRARRPAPDGADRRHARHEGLRPGGLRSGAGRHQGARHLRGDRDLQRQRLRPAGRRLHARPEQGALRGAPSRGRRGHDQRGADLPGRPHALRRHQELGHGP